MVRAATTADPFNAVGEGRRRDILNFLLEGERPVNDIVESLGLAQPQVSKHLRVLREVDLVRVRGSGRRRLYSLNGPRLKPIFDWAQTFERFWDHKLDRIRQRAESAAERAPSETTSTQRKEQP